MPALRDFFVPVPYLKIGEILPIVYQLVYISKALHPLESDQISRILDLARANNARDNITGLLLYHDQIFFQVLEGERCSVSTCYARILLDRDHRDVACLWQGIVSNRTFPNWAMGYADPSKLDRQIRGYLISLARLKNNDGAMFKGSSAATDLVQWILRDFTDIQ